MKPAKTEQRNARSRGLDRKSTLEILRALNREDARVAAAVRRELPAIARAVDAIVNAFRSGGRLFYVGAGTSGRLAVLDAAECPPTFGTPPSLVQAIIAGGTRALRRASEGAEDSAADGARDLRRAGVQPRDVVVGLSASGTTPYVLGALDFARRCGAKTVGMTSNPRSALARHAGIAIAPDTGPEAIAGSTRLKAGTAQKLVVNAISTVTFVRLGRTYGGLMVAVAPDNEKLRARARRNVALATGASEERVDAWPAAGAGGFRGAVGDRYRIEEALGGLVLDLQCRAKVRQDLAPRKFAQPARERDIFPNLAIAQRFAASHHETS